MDSILNYKDGTFNLLSGYFSGGIQRRCLMCRVLNALMALIVSHDLR